MEHVPDLRETIPLPPEIAQAGREGNLVLFVGAGASRLLGFPSWDGLADLALEDLRQARFLNYSEIDQLKTQDAKKRLSIAALISDENGYKLDLAKHLVGKAEGDSIYKALNDIGCPSVTTNYDELLAPRYRNVADGSVTAESISRISEPDKFLAKLLDEPGTVVHLHGCVSKPETMIVTTKQYLEHYDHDNVQHFLKGLFSTKTVVFLGYGLEEAEILEHILRRAQVVPTGQLNRFSVQGFFQSQVPLYKQLHKYHKKSFGVQLLGFVRDHEGYGGLDRTVKLWAEELEISKPPLLDDVTLMDKVLVDD